MPIITEKIKHIQEKKKISLKQLAKIINYSHSGLSNMINTKAPFTQLIIEKLLPIIEVSREEFESWIIADKYTKEVLKLAIQNKKEFKYKQKSMLTTKIDEILKEKKLSRTDLSKQIKYSQSGLNRMIIGQIDMSKSVMERIATVLEISQNDILSWIVADKYNLNVLELALREKS